MIETLPLELRFKIIKLLDINDRVCFALTSRTMAQAIARITKPSDLEYEMEYDLYGLEEHEELMDRLCAWMPSYLRYCYHCVAFVPRLSFGPTHDELDQLVCMDCRFYGHKRLRPFTGSSDECDGCLSLDAAVDNHLDEHPEMGSMYVWDRLSGRLLDEVSLTIDSEGYWTLT